MKTKTFTFGTYITIEALDESDALWTYDRIKEMNGVVNAYCFEWKEDNE